MRDGPASPAGLQPPDEYLDPISNDVMQDPVILAATGQTYERSSITTWLKRCAREGRVPTDPLTGVELHGEGGAQVSLAKDGLPGLAQASASWAACLPAAAGRGGPTAGLIQDGINR